MGCILEQTSALRAEAKGRRFFFISFTGRVVSDEGREIPFTSVYEPFSGWVLEKESTDTAAFYALVPEGYFQAFCLDVLKESHMGFRVRWHLENENGKLRITKLRAVTSQNTL
ncbi:hypothetical protein SAMN02746041_01624 [Desulfacinum hydrothermale DSM 13146]|uniref:Uncharacterized protein n=1 Tax=Desulfacinum hydrothermale DSM 13146 TaxID=1121390 RepID=A0A1W1XGE9_9BACT|nr:hypothetical protein [Desulfacinum hydrothermale]SMC23020.1 hypothetical protein SAMN02746041_01624 [Desulfacinum hydrothermale DSM 13146]